MDHRLAEMLVPFDARERLRAAERHRLLDQLRASHGHGSSLRRWLGARLVGLGTRLEAAAGPVPASGWSPSPPLSSPR